MAQGKYPEWMGKMRGLTEEELAEFLTKGTYADARPGGWDPAERLKDNALDGVEADVLYTTLGFRIFWLKDAGLQQDCFRVYNDWLAAYCRYAPTRTAGPAPGRTRRARPAAESSACGSAATCSAGSSTPDRRRTAGSR